MIFSPDERYIVIADSCYRSVFSALKSAYKDIDVRFMDRREAFSSLSYSYSADIDPISLFLRKEKYSYSKCKKLLRILRAGEFSSSSPFYEMREELINKGALFKDELSLYKLKSGKVLLFEDDEDMELKALLKKNEISFSEIHFTDIDYSFDKEKIGRVLLFPDKIHQFSYVFSHIREDILSKGIKAEDIGIIIHDDSDMYFIDLFSTLFDIRCSAVVRRSLLSDRTANRLIASFRRKGNLEIEEEFKEREAAKRISSLIERYSLSEISFEFALPSLMEICASETTSDPDDGIGVGVRSSLSFQNRIKYYVTNFQHGDFYKVYSDDDIVSDEELRSMSLNPSYVTTALDKRKKMNFLKYMDVSLFSRVELHQDDKIFPSQLLEETVDSDGENVRLKEEKTGISEEGIYTERAREYVYSLYKDSVFAPKDKIYSSYDNSFNGIEGVETPKVFSVSHVSDYFTCPFMFLLSQVLSISNTSLNLDPFVAHFGTFTHSIFEKVYSKEDSFDIAYNRAYASFLKNNKEPDSRELAFFEVSRPHLERFYSYIRKAVDASSGSRIDEIREEHEKKIEFDIDVDSVSYKIKGRTDKVIHVPINGEIYFSIIDYKTGNVDFDYKVCFLGGDLQLPLYYYSMKDEYLEKGEVFAFFGIQTVFSKNPPKSGNIYGEEAIKEVTRIKATTLNSPEFYSYFDPSIIAKNDKLDKGDFVQAKLLFDSDGEGSLKKNQKYSFNDLISDSISALKEMIRKVSKGEYPIAPTITKANDRPCGNCGFRNICYRKTDDIVDVSPEIRKHFLSRKEEEDQDAVQ